ncbi:hypothetical protein BJV78DRAFT_1383712 [Lactifluus subvellereus]|nr:hypothetical protein BJV78DRAFT_1383712 [Lactifluus subvellereus]
MDPPPVPISLYTINLVLQYISPPSQLANPIPSNLLSHSLLQRHVLLEISPADSSSYLSWPSSGRERAIQHLESLQMPLDELASDFLAGYTADSEHVYAHVHVKPTGDDGLRLVFEWDGQDSWKYHDSNVMPFPPGTRPSLSDAIAATTTVSSPELSGTNQEKTGNDDGESSDNDYWNSYGMEDGRGMQLLSSTSKGETDANEDAYWARYASVQGTADSTIPSPVHKTTRRLQSVPVAQHVSCEEIISTVTADTRPHHRDPKAPPSPNTIRHRLTALSPRPLDISPPSDAFTEPDSEDIPGATDDDTESPSSFLDHKTHWERGTVQRSREECIASSTVATETVNSFSRQGMNQGDDSRALQDAVRGLFWLWKTTRQGSRSFPGETKEASTDELDRADFLQLVGRAIATPK